MAYGDKRDYPKIDIYVRKWLPDGSAKVWTYVATTTWAKTCREAVMHWQDANGYGPKGDVIARFQYGKRR